MTGAAEQTYRERPPAPELAPYVTCVWVQEVAPGTAPYDHRTVPNGSAELVCPIGEEPRIVGPQTGAMREVLAPGTTVVGVRFRPGAAPAALGVPASELVDLAIGADELWGGSMSAELGERVAAAPERAAATLEAAVRARVSDELDPLTVEAVRRLLPWRSGDVGGLPSALYISERQLRRRFDAAVGFSPKVLQRMLRFQGFLALAHAHGRPHGELAALAFDAGYADQSHLTRESLRLAGQSPRTLLLEAERHCAPGHDHRASYGPLLRARATA